MSTERLTGNFSYYTLKQAVKKKGVKDADLSAALSRIANANNIDDIKNLDGSEKISINTSVFEQYISNNAANPVNQEEPLAAYNKNSSLLNPDTDINTLPGIYNDDDYDVVDYDEFYGFESEDVDEDIDNADNAEEENKPKDNIKLDFDDFKDNFEDLFEKEIKTSKNKDKALENIFNKFDKNSDSYLDGKELEGAKLLNPYLKNQNSQDMSSIEGEDGISLTMQMDMSGNSFDPQ